MNLNRHLKSLAVAAALLAVPLLAIPGAARADPRISVSFGVPLAQPVYVQPYGYGYPAPRVVYRPAPLLSAYYVPQRGGYGYRPAPRPWRHNWNHGHDAGHHHGRH